MLSTPPNGGRSVKPFCRARSPNGPPSKRHKNFLGKTTALKKEYINKDNIFFATC